MISISKDTANKTMHIVREFNAPRQKVWSAWTESNILDQWWGPKPWHVETKTMNFKNGGHWLYAMIGPEGETHWSICTYHAIDAPNSFKSTTKFSDENGNPIDDDVPSYWLVEMSENNGVTTVNVTLTFADTAGLEQLVSMGFEGGFTICLNQLEELLG
ncbi:SRPBCC family protein [Mucilaginibacter lappiensis]|uniref:SRPBCC family protein n=1 Tax=Mucilaginibacter lappiensis TaxID=354630 RepID=UPI003D2114B4